MEACREQQRQRELFSAVSAFNSENSFHIYSYLLTEQTCNSKEATQLMQCLHALYMFLYENGTNADVYRLWQRQEEELCAHLHEQPLLPQFLIKDENIWICSDHVGVEVHDPQTLQAPSTRQGHVSLAALKHARQRDFHTVQCHSLKLMKSRLELIGIKGFKIKTSSLIF